MGCSMNRLQPHNLDLICSNSTIYAPAVWSCVRAVCLTFDARISGFVSEPEAFICLFIAHHLSVTSSLLYLCACDSITYLCCLPDLRCEAIRLCLGASCHLSFIAHHLPSCSCFVIYTPDQIAYSRFLPDLRREDIRLCLGASCYLTIHYSPPFLPPPSPAYLPPSEFQRCPPTRKNRNLPHSGSLEVPCFRSFD